MKQLTTQSESELSQQDIKYILRRQKERATDYCSACGGSGQRRTGIFGTPKLDFTKCTPCNGTGQKRKARGNKESFFMQPWKNEISHPGNHERFITCSACGHEYNLWTHGWSCPKCNANNE